MRQAGNVLGRNKGGREHRETKVVWRGRRDIQEGGEVMSALKRSINLTLIVSSPLQVTLLPCTHTHVHLLSSLTPDEWICGGEE